MTELVSQILEKFTLPEMTLSKFDPTFDEIVLNNYRSKRTINMSPDDVRHLGDNLDAWLYATDVDEIMKSPDDQSPICEPQARYFGGIEKLYPMVPSVRYMLSTNRDVSVDVFGAETLMDESKRDPIMQKYLPYEQPRQTGPAETVEGHPIFEFQRPSTIVYSSFVEPKYEYGTFVKCFIDKCNLLAINLPYDFYHYQPLYPNIFNLNVDSGKFEFSWRDEDTFRELLYQTYHHGFTEPVPFCMSGGVLVPYGDDGMIQLFIAKLLKLPTIPALIILSNDRSLTHFGMEGIMIHDGSIRNKARTATQHIRHMLMPYVAIMDAPFDPEKSTFDINGVSYKKDLYRKLTNYQDDTVYCLATDVDTEAMNSSEERVLKAQKELQEKAAAEWKNKIAEVRQRLEPK